MEQRACTVDISFLEEVMNSNAAHDVMSSSEYKENCQYMESCQKEDNDEHKVAHFLRTKRQSMPQVSRVPCSFPGSGDLTKAIVKKLLPPRAQVQRDRFNGRWYVRFGRDMGGWSMSKSWGRGPERPVILSLLQQVWKQYEHVTNGKCWVDNLF